MLDAQEQPNTADNQSHQAATSSSEAAAMSGPETTVQMAQQLREAQQEVVIAQACATVKTGMPAHSRELLIN